jgi:ADP-heptose:LPS heptosyltransferase
VALSRRPRLLALRALGLGDFLTGVPALRALRRAHPEHELVLAAPQVLAPLVELADVADRLLDTRALASPAWAGAAPDLAINLHGSGPQSHALLQALHPGRLVGFGCDAAGHRGPQWDPDEHERRRWCRLLEEDLHVPTDHTDLLLARPAAPGVAPGSVVVHPGAAYPSRRWPADRFAAVARQLVEQGCDVVVTGGRDEVDLAAAVVRRAGLPSHAVLAGRTDLAGLAARVAAARLVVCGDTGVAHLASAFGTPSVLLFGPTPPARWGPPGDGPHAVLWHGGGPGDPCGDRVDPALLRIGVGEVLEHALAMLRDAGPAAAANAPTAGPRTTQGSA